MCYNVLCDKYATRQLYGYCPSWALNWEYRKKAIMQEILSCNADIISLQVKDVPLFLSLFYSPVLVSPHEMYLQQTVSFQNLLKTKAKKEVVFRTLFVAWHQKNAFQPTLLECEPAAADQRSVRGGVFVPLCVYGAVIDIFSNKKLEIIITLGITEIHLYFLKTGILLWNLHSLMYLILTFFSP